MPAGGKRAMVSLVSNLWSTRVRSMPITEAGEVRRGQPRACVDRSGYQQRRRRACLLVPRLANPFFAAGRRKEWVGQQRQHAADHGAGDPGQVWGAVPGLQVSRAPPGRISICLLSLDFAGTFECSMHVHGLLDAQACVGSATAPQRPPVRLHSVRGGQARRAGCQGLPAGRLHR